jgi:hypothetical protein
MYTNKVVNISTKCMVFKELALLLICSEQVQNANKLDGLILYSEIHCNQKQNARKRS